MVLKSKKSTAKTEDKPTTETVEQIHDPKVVEAAEPEVETAAPVPAAAPAPPAPPAPATLPGGQFASVFDGFVEAQPPIEFGVLSRITASNGNVMINKSDMLGSEIEVTLHSINYNYVTSPGGNSKESRELCRFSRVAGQISGAYDDVSGEWIDDGITLSPVADYLKFLKAAGFTKAATKTYIELLCTLNDAGQDHEAIGQLVQLSLSPQSVKAWTGFALHSTLNYNAGKIPANEVATFKVVAKAESFDSNNYTIFNFKR